jgi:DNA-binding Xre family transcriptional regulator
MLYAIIVLAVIAFILQLPPVKGYFGELTVRILLKFLDKEKYRVINDVLIPTSSDKTAQIDHIVVSIYGIFVIETKNYSGWIFGDETSQYWTQVIYKTKNRFYNPILQNKGHIKALQNLLKDYPHVKYIPIVVFTSKADFKKLNVTSHVIYSLQLLKTIKKYKDENIELDDLEKICKTILAANNTDRIARKEHVARIKEVKSISKK